MTKRRLNEQGQERSLNAIHDWNEFYCSTRHQGFGGVGCHRCGVHGRRALLGGITIGTKIEVNGGG
jgi:hypothetical protein